MSQDSSQEDPLGQVSSTQNKQVSLNNENMHILDNCNLLGTNSVCYRPSLQIAEDRPSDVSSPGMKLREVILSIRMRERPSIEYSKYVVSKVDLGSENKPEAG